MYIHVRYNMRHKPYRTLLIADCQEWIEQVMHYAWRQGLITYYILLHNILHIITYYIPGHLTFNNVRSQNVRCQKVERSKIKFSSTQLTLCVADLPPMRHSFILSPLFGSQWQPESGCQFLDMLQHGGVTRRVHVSMTSAVVLAEVIAQ